MSDRGEVVSAAEQAVADKLAAAGADQIRRHTFDEAPEIVATAPEPAAEAPAPEIVPEEGQISTQAPAEPAAPAVEDPTAAAVLGKYENDPVKLAQAYAALQKKLGEQGTELGAQRQENQELSQVLAEIAAVREQIQQQPQVPPFVQQNVDWFDQAVYDNPRQAMDWASRQPNAELLFQRGLETWKQTDPFAAADYVNQLRLVQLEQRFAQQRPSNDSIEIQSALNQVLAENREFVQYAEDLPNIIQSYPVVAAGLSGDAQQKTEAIRTLFALAERDTLRSLALTGATPAAPATDVAVATPTNSEAHEVEAPAQPTPLDQWRQQFREEAERQQKGAFTYVAR